MGIVPRHTSIFSLLCARLSFLAAHFHIGDLILFWLGITFNVVVIANMAKRNYDLPAPQFRTLTLKFGQSQCSRADFIFNLLLWFSSGMLTLRTRRHAFA